MASPVRKGKKEPPRFIVGMQNYAMESSLKKVNNEDGNGRRSITDEPKTNIKHGYNNGQKAKVWDVPKTHDGQETNGKNDQAVDKNHLSQNMYEGTSAHVYFDKAKWYDDGAPWNLPTDPFTNMGEFDKAKWYEDIFIFEPYERTPPPPPIRHTGRKITGAKDRVSHLIPACHVPEKIIVVLDRAREATTGYFELANKLRLFPLTMVKKTLKHFVQNKHAFNRKHEFGIITMNSTTSTWVCDFTSKIENFIDTLDYIDESHTENVFDINTIFDVILKKIDVDELTNVDAPPKYVVRVLLMYGRSVTVPVVKMTNEIRKVMSSPNFIFDVVMIHEQPNPRNKVLKIIDNLSQLTRGGYLFPVGTNANDLEAAMAKLICHPLERLTNSNIDM